MNIVPNVPNKTNAYINTHGVLYTDDVLQERKTLIEQIARDVCMCVWGGGVESGGEARSLSGAPGRLSIDSDSNPLRPFFAWQKSVIFIVEVLATAMRLNHSGMVREGEMERERKREKEREGEGGGERKKERGGERKKERGGDQFQVC